MHNLNLVKWYIYYLNYKFLCY